MIDWIFITFYLIEIMIIGETILGILHIKDLSLSERIGVSIIVGFGTLSSIIFYLGLMKIPLTTLLLISIYILFVVLYFFFHLHYNIKFASFSFIEKISIFLIIIYFIIIIIDSIIVPLNAGDAISIWGFKAKIIYYKGLYGFFSPLRIAPHSRYPLLIPIVEAGFYKLSGILDDRLVKLIFPFLFMSTVLLVYAFQRELNIRKKYALLMLFLLIFVPNYYSMRGGKIGSGFVDIPLSAFIFGTLFSFYKYLNKKDSKYVILAGILTAFSIFTKNEGFGIFLYITISIVYFASKKEIDIKDVFLYFFFVIILISPWIAFRTHLSTRYEENYIRHITDFVRNSSRIPSIMLYLFKEMFNPLKWAFFWYIPLVIFIIKPQSILRKENKILLLYIAFTLILYIFIFTITPWQNYKYQMTVCWGRLLMHICPIALIFISNAVKSYWQRD